MSKTSAEPLEQALQQQREAAVLGFDWRHVDELWDKLAEEIGELKEAVHDSQDAVEDELGDLLFMAVNIARHLGVDAGSALRRSNAKFARRFAHICGHLDSLPPPGDPQRLDAMEALWQEAKRQEKR